MVEDTVRRPWHHGCFSLRTGEALAARALTVTALWQVERRNGRLCVCEKIISIARRMLAKLHPGAGVPERMLIIGGGAEGYAAAEMLRRESHRGEVIILSAGDTLPYDRPNLSKDDLIGTTPKKGIPLRPKEVYAENGIDLQLGITATSIDHTERRVIHGSDEAIAFTKLLMLQTPRRYGSKCRVQSFCMFARSPALVR